MEAFGNVIVLESAKKVFYDVLLNKKEVNILPKSEGKELIEKARKVLNDIEETWEVDHMAVELRDRFHLLRHYLERLGL